MASTFFLCFGGFGALVVVVVVVVVVGFGGQNKKTAQICCDYKQAL
jgi:hypothetical protein